MSDIDYERYECWTSARRRVVKLIHHPGEKAYYAIPAEVRHQGPWTDAERGLTVNLKPEYRCVLARDGYVEIEVDMKSRASFHPEVGKGEADAARVKNKVGNKR